MGEGGERGFAEQIMFAKTIMREGCTAQFLAEFRGGAGDQGIVVPFHCALLFWCIIRQPMLDSCKEDRD